MSLLDQHISFDPTGDFAGFLETVPAKWVVYLLSDEQSRPFQLLCVKNLRASLANRLTEHPADEKTRSIPYRQVVRHISYRRVDSTLEAEWVYTQLAHEFFPDAYRKMLANWAPWYISTDPASRFPRWIITDQPDAAMLSTTFGPIPTKSAAQKLVETIEDAFDLCRYYHILVQAPHGQACAYKQMGKCPAPCDGSIPLEQYHQQIDQSLAAVRNPAPSDEHEQSMRQAAADLQFELAAKIKSRMRQLESLKTAGRSLDQFRFVALCRGSKAKAYKLMFLTPQRIAVSDEWTTQVQLAQIFPTLGTVPPAVPSFDTALLTFISRHILLNSADSILLDDPDVVTILAATGRLVRRKQDVEPSDEGVVQAS